MKSKIALLIDSGSDLNNNLIKNSNLFVLPLQVIIDGVEYKDSNTLDLVQLYKDMETKAVSTSLPSPKQIHETIQNIVDNGFTHIIAITISSGLSGTHNIIRQMLEEFDGIKSTIIDTKNISFGSGLLGLQVLEDIDKGLSYDDIIVRVKDKLNDSKVFFTIGTLEYLKRGGRIGKVAGTIATTLNIKPVISCNEDGVYYTVKKTRGYSKSINLVIDCAAECASKYKEVKVVLLSVMSEQDLNKISEQIKEKIPNIKSFSSEIVSPALGVHTGPEAIGVAIISLD